MSDEVVHPDLKGRSGLLDAVERLNEAIDQKDAELERLRKRNKELAAIIDDDRPWWPAELERLREDNEKLRDERQEIENYLRARLHRIEEAARRLDKAATHAEQKGAQWFPHAFLTALRAALEEEA